MYKSYKSYRFFEYPISAMRNSMTLMEQTDYTQSDTGEATPVYTQRGKPWVGIDIVSASQVEVSRGYAPTVNAVLTTYFSAKFTIKCKLVHSDGREFFVNGVVDPDGRRKWHRLYCTQQN